ncbi:MAG: thioredoxin family protein, partial [Flavobacteriales bacterium]
IYMWISLIIMLMLKNQPVKSLVVPVEKPVITWISFEQAIEANKTNKKKIFIDLYTPWCGWCKVMDNKTFADSAVAAYMNANFYCVKFNAEQTDTIYYRGHKFGTRAGSRTHELALSLLNNNPSYPSFVVLTEKENRLTIISGYQEKTVFLQNLKTLAAYKEK